MTRPLVIDNFAGGGGASTGIEAALGRPVDYAINHDAEAVAMHAANHPATAHFCQSIMAVDPLEVTRGRRVALAWFSPDCKHFSKAKGGKPVEKNIRDLAWIVVHWAERLKGRGQPAVIMLENVEEFRTWGPLAEDGRPCPERRGQTFDAWVAKLRRAGYRVQWKELRACDYGAPTSRKRLFMIARSDSQPIVWPKPTHGRPGSGLLPWRTAADIIDWTIPCPSIFERTRPLKEATCRRIATGIMRHVVNNPQRFIIPLTHAGGPGRAYSIDEPIPTVTGAHRGEMALVTPTVISVDNTSTRASRAFPAEDPLRTITSAGGGFAMVAAFLAQHNTMPHGGVHPGKSADHPLSTITARGTQQTVVASSLVKLRGTSRDGQPTDEPLHTVSAGGTHFGEVRAFLIKYYGAAAHGQPVDRPLDAATAKARFGLVTVTIDGEEYAIADIGMRMLTPRELARAQGFPDDYILDPVVGRKPLTKTAQIRMIGNSVCPPIAEALVRANLPALAVPEAEEIAA